jgi:uncharacterized protein (DUF4415 family)
MKGKVTGDSAKVVRFSRLEDVPRRPLPAAVKDMSDEDVARRAAEDPDASLTPPGFWDNARMIEPDTTEQVTLRLPKRVLAHFRASGKGYQSRISAVLASYVDAKRKAENFFPCPQTRTKNGKRPR